MVYWLTGQPGSGKTILGIKLKNYLQSIKKEWGNEVFHLDGDHLRDLTNNKDYSEEGRRNNIRNAQMITEYLHINGYDVVVSLVAPFLDLREEFKSKLSENIKEIYVHCSDERPRSEYKVKDYQPPIDNYIDIDTTLDSEYESLVKIVKQI
jgi:adenylylsulfate kinase-like enzyme